MDDLIHKLLYTLRCLSLLVIAGCTPFITTCSPFVSRWEQVLDEGVIRVGTLNGITSYYSGPHGETGFDFDLLVKLSAVLNLDFELAVAESREELSLWIDQNRIHIAAADLIVEREIDNLRFTQPLRKIRRRLVYSRGRRGPKSADVVNLPVLIPEFRSITGTPPVLPDNWTVVTNDDSTEEILHAVARRDAAYAVVSSDLLAIHRRYLTGLRSAFAIGPELHIAWALPNEPDDSIFNKVVGGLAQIERNGDLRRVHDRHFGHIRRIDIYSNETLEDHIKSRLPKLEPMFKKAAGATWIDWRLLAAVGYQESHWNPKAKSPTGVRGLMMLTRATAKEMGIKNRRDAAQSIDGGAKYFARLKRRLPENIDEPDRSWLALAAYNLGYGHLLDVRDLTRQHDGNPDLWVDIRKHLPLLTVPKWHTKTTYGYARGFEAISYVENIRSYYDVLRFRFPTEAKQKESEALVPTRSKPRRYGPRRR